MRRTGAAAAALLLLLAVPAAARAGAEGAALFEARCASCHQVQREAPPGPGPNLAGVVGRRIGGDPEFGYSPVIEAARDEGQAWDAARLDRFLADPEEMFPGLWMGANGVRAAAERAAIVAFLASLR